MSRLFFVIILTWPRLIKSRRDRVPRGGICVHVERSWVPYLRFPQRPGWAPSQVAEQGGRRLRAVMIDGAPHVFPKRCPSPP